MIEFEEVGLMPSTTVRIRIGTKKTLQQLAAQTGQKTQKILDDAIEVYRRQLFLDQANAAFAALRADSDEWRTEQEERRAWENTLSDGQEG